MSPKLVFMLLICVAARQTYAFWVYGNGPNGLETDVGVEDRAYVNDRDVESTDGPSDKNAAVVDTQLSSGANNWATHEENSLSGDSFESEEGMSKKKRNDDMTDDREYKAMERMNNENLDNTEGDNTPLYEDLIRRRRSFISNDDDDDTGADLQNESDNSNFEDGIKVSVVRRDAERGQYKNKRNTLNVDGLTAKRSATSEINKNGNKTKNATREPRQLNSPLPVHSASPPSDSQIQHDLDAANTLINKMKYSINDDDDDDNDDDENNSDEDTAEDDSVNGESKRAVDANKGQQLSGHHKENMNKRTGDIDVASRKILSNDNDDYDDEESGLFRKRDSNIDYDDDYDTDDNNIESPIRHKRESGIDDGPYDDDDEDADDDDVLWKRDTSSDTGLYDDDDADYDDVNGAFSFRRKRETILDEGPEDDDDEDNDEDDDEYTDDNDDNRRRKSLNDGLDYGEEFNHDDNGDVDKGSTARQKKDTNIDSESDEDDDANEYDENDQVAIRRKRNTAYGQSDTAERAFVREKKSKDHGINTDERVLPDKENAIVVSDSDVKNRKARAVYAYTELDQTPDAGYGVWSEWSECSETCGIGRRFRKRLCYDTNHCRDGDLEENICEGTNCSGKGN